MIRDKATTKAASTCDASKRDFIRKAAYAAPAILSLQAYSALAKAGSTKPVPTKPDQPSTSVRDQRRDQVKKILCELDNRVRVRQGRKPRSC